MNHPSDDKVLEFVLGTLEESEHLEIGAHVGECDRCSDLQRRFKDQVERIAGVEMQIDMPEAMRGAGTPRRLKLTWRWAAVLAVGFLLGFLSARLSESHLSIPVPQRLITTPSPVSASGFVSCQAIDLKPSHNW